MRSLMLVGVVLEASGREKVSWTALEARYDPVTRQVRDFLVPRSGSHEFFNEEACLSLDTITVH